MIEMVTSQMIGVIALSIDLLSFFRNTTILYSVYCMDSTFLMIVFSV